MKEALIDLQTRLAFLDDTVQTLNDAVAGHEQQIEHLERALRVVQEQMQSLQADSPAGDIDDVPPHF